MSVVEQIPFENVMSVIKVMEPSVSTVDGSTTKLFQGKILVEYDPDLQQIDVSVGDTVTLEMSDRRLNAQYQVLDVKSSGRGYEQVLLKYNADKHRELVKGGVPVWLRLLDVDKVSGKIYFGKRNVITATGGIATQVASTDFGMVIIGIAILSVIIGSVYQFFIKDTNPVVIREAA